MVHASLRRLSRDLGNGSGAARFLNKHNLHENATQWSAAITSICLARGGGSTRPHRLTLPYCMGRQLRAECCGAFRLLQSSMGAVWAAKMLCVQVHGNAVSN
jgi:hypothetical protein